MMTTNLLHRYFFFAFLACAVAASLAQAAEREFPPAFGPYVKLTEKDFAESKSFSAQDRLVGTYYFYWYDIYTGAHLRDGDGTDALTTHPPTLDDFSYKSVRWHKRQLADMEAAGIDLALMVFWGSPAERETAAGVPWSFAGLKPLVEAREELLREGKNPPRIGLFYDTSTLQWNPWRYRVDLTTDFGKQFFYGTVRDFYSCIPPKHWAAIDGKPIVLLYAAAFAEKWDQGFIDYTKAEFPKEFGGRVPWIAPQDSWRVKGDSTCAWGGALAPRNPGIGEIGPGYDHSAVPGREPLVRRREQGKFYEESWLKFLRRPSNFVMIETWNEFHEGTDIAESKEYGRQYIELTRKYADLFKKGWKPPWPKDSFHGAPSLSAAADDGKTYRGLILADAEDGKTELAEIEGRKVWLGKPHRGNEVRYFYFRVDDDFKPDGAMKATLEIEYLDLAPGRLGVEFDGSDPHAPFGGAYSRTETIPLVGDNRPKTARFALDAARFRNSQNAGADFRIVVVSGKFGLCKVTLKRR
ncbi:MAG: DUF5010 domain-containing protein [Pirellulales bacterium]|nr:DUF5010 domain-containing protein [Pirellulales bacterium]